MRLICDDKRCRFFKSFSVFVDHADGVVSKTGEACEAEEFLDERWRWQVEGDGHEDDDDGERDG